MGEKEEHVTKAEFEEFAEAITETLSKRLEGIKKEIEAVRSESEKPKDMAIYKCTEEGCSYVTDDIGSFIEHTVKEELKKRPPASASEETEKPKHTTIEEFLACPECFPEIEKAFLQRGWKKPEPKRKSGLLL